MMKIIKKSFEKYNIEIVKMKWDNLIGCSKKSFKKAGNKYIRDIFINKISIKKMVEKAKELEEKYDLGIEEFLRFLLTKYPYDGCIFSEEMLQEYNNNKRVFLIKLSRNYNKLGCSSLNSNNIDLSIQKKKIIKEYLNNCINNLQD